MNLKEAKKRGVKFFKQLFCHHNYNWEFISHIDCSRRLYKCTCKKCGKVTGKLKRE